MEDWNEKPLIECLLYLANLYEDFDCMLECKKEFVEYVGLNWEEQQDFLRECRHYPDGCKSQIGKGEHHDNCPQRISFERIKAVIDKAEPKKNGWLPNGEPCCPVCGLPIRTDVHTYCASCGQKLDCRLG